MRCAKNKRCVGGKGGEGAKCKTYNIDKFDEIFLHLEKKGDYTLKKKRQAFKKG